MSHSSVSPSLTHTHTHNPFLPLGLHNHRISSFSPALSLSLSHTLTHISFLPSLSLTPPTSLTHTHTHTHTFFPLFTLLCIIKVICATAAPNNAKVLWWRSFVGQRAFLSNFSQDQSINGCVPSRNADWSPHSQKFSGSFFLPGIRALDLLPLETEVPDMAISMPTALVNCLDSPMTARFRGPHPKKQQLPRSLSFPLSASLPGLLPSALLKKPGNLGFTRRPDLYGLWKGDRTGMIAVRASSASYGGTSQEESLKIAGLTFSKRDLQIATAATVTVVLAVGNRVLYKLALVPLMNYPFFLAQLTTFGYVLVYFSILFVRYRAGIVTAEMLAIPKSRFIVIGALEALGAASGMAAGAILPGASIPILTQTFLVWQLILSVAFLNKRYSFTQVMGCLMVMVGVVLALSSGGVFDQSLQQAGLFWPLLMILSSAFQASASILKEFVFRDSAPRLKGGSVDLFVVNSFGSGFQALFILLMLPFLSKLRGIPFSELPAYLKDGAACFFNIGSLSTECNGAPLIPLLYVVVNMGFNISLLYLLKISSAVVSSLCTTLSVPLSIYIFTLPLPYIGVPASLPPQFFFGVVVLLAGLAFYNFSSQFRQLFKDE